MLESATFYIHTDMNDFTDIEKYRDFIMSAGNITDDEKGPSFWEWIILFPRELKKVLLSYSFKNYMKWENQWIQQQNILHKNQLEFLKSCMDFCVKYYYSPIITKEQYERFKANFCYCGHDCSKCITYIATQQNDNNLRRQSQSFYKEKFGLDIPLEKFNCNGG